MLETVTEIKKVQFLRQMDSCVKKMLIQSWKYRITSKKINSWQKKDD